MFETTKRQTTIVASNKPRLKAVGYFANHFANRRFTRMSNRAPP